MTLPTSSPSSPTFIAKQRAAYGDYLMSKLQGNGNKEVTREMDYAYMLWSIEAKVKRVPADLKLTGLYLMDSTLKHISDQNKALYSHKIISAFTEVFKSSNVKDRADMYRLRRTWNAVLPAKTLLYLDEAVHNLDPAWPITNHKDDDSADETNNHNNHAHAGNQSENAKPTHQSNVDHSPPELMTMEAKLMKLNKNEKLMIEPAKLRQNNRQQEEVLLLPAAAAEPVLSKPGAQQVFFHVNCIISFRFA